MNNFKTTTRSRLKVKNNSRILYVFSFLIAFLCVINVSAQTNIYDLDADNDGILDIDEGICSTSGTLVWDATPTTSSEFDWLNPGTSLSNTFNNISGSGINTTISFTGDTGTLADWNGTGGNSTPEVASDNGAEALQYYTTGFNATGITITISFSEPVNDVDFVLAHINSNSTNGDEFTITANDIVSGTIFPTFTPSANPSYTTNAVGVVDANNISTTGDNDEVGINFNSSNGINSITIVWDECSVCTAGTVHGSAIRDISFCVSLDTDNDGIPDYLDTDSDNDGCPDAIEANENVTASQLDANGAIDFANLTGADAGADANGVPNLVNSGGSADVGGDQGQGTTTGVVTSDVISTVVISPNPAGVCENSNATFTATATGVRVTDFGTTGATSDDTTIPIPSSDYIYKWYLGASTTPLTDIAPYSGTSTSVLTITNATLSLDTNEYRVEVITINNNCPVEDTAILNVLDPILVPNITYYCDGDTPNPITATGEPNTTFNWYSDASLMTPLTGVSGVNNETWTPTNTIGTQTAYVTQPTSSCNNVKEVNVVVTDTLLAPTAQSASYCEGDTIVDVTATGVTGATYTWYSDASLSTAIATGAIWSPTGTIGTETVYVTQFLNQCTSTATTVVIVVNATPTAPTIAPASAEYCDGDVIADRTASGETGATFIWYSDAELTTLYAGTTSGTNNEIWTPTGSVGTETVFVTQTLNGCTSEATSSSITVKPMPLAPTAQSQSYCTGDTILPVNASGVTGATYTWYSDSGLTTVIPTGTTEGTTSGTNNETWTPDSTLATQTVWVVQTATNGCIGEATQVDITIGDTLTLTYDPSDSTICSGEEAVINITGDNGVPLSWESDILGISGTGTTINTGILYNKGTDPYTVTFAVSATATGYCDVEQGSTVTVTVLPEPQITSTSQFIICSSDGLSFTVNSLLAGTTIDWELTDDSAPSTVIDSGTGTDTLTISKTGLATGNYTYTITGTNGACTSEPLLIPVTVN